MQEKLKFKIVLNSWKIQLFITICFSDSGYRDTPLRTTLFSDPESVGITRFDFNMFSETVEIRNSPSSYGRTDRSSGEVEFEVKWRGKHSPSVSILSAARKDTRGTILCPVSMVRSDLRRERHGGQYTEWTGSEGGPPSSSSRRDGQARPRSDFPDTRSNETACWTTLFPDFARWRHSGQWCSECVRNLLSRVFTSGSVGQSRLCERKNRVSFSRKALSIPFGHSGSIRDNMSPKKWRLTLSFWWQDITSRMWPPQNFLL